MGIGVHRVIHTCGYCGTLGYMESLIPLGIGDSVVYRVTRTAGNLVIRVHRVIHTCENLGVGVHRVFYTPGNLGLCCYGTLGAPGTPSHYGH